MLGKWCASLMTLIQVGGTGANVMWPLIATGGANVMACGWPLIGLIQVGLMWMMTCMLLLLADGLDFECYVVVHVYDTELAVYTAS
jgi:hypothetical protein